MVLQDLGKPVYSGRPHDFRVRFVNDFLLTPEMRQEFEAFLHEVVGGRMPYFRSSVTWDGGMPNRRRLYPTRSHLSL